MSWISACSLQNKSIRVGNANKCVKYVCLNTCIAYRQLNDIKLRYLNCWFLVFQAPRIVNVSIPTKICQSVSLFNKCAKYWKFTYLTLLSYDTHLIPWKWQIFENCLYWLSNFLRAGFAFILFNFVVHKRISQRPTLVLVFWGDI